MISPITKSNNVKLYREILTSEIISTYNKTYNIDVSRFFVDLEKVQVYES